jgi:ketosteroid isomerase-like protein
MYHRIVKGIISKGFQDISNQDYEPLLKQFAPDIHFTFVGQHAMGADFHNRDTVRQWFHRLHRIFPGFKIVPDRIIVSGFPWNTNAAVQFTVSDTLPDGSQYINRGTQFVRIVWGRVVEDHLLDDSQLMVQTLISLSEKHGRQEALSAPLQDVV